MSLISTFFLNIKTRVNTSELSLIPLFFLVFPYVLGVDTSYALKGHVVGHVQMELTQMYCNAMHDMKINNAPSLCNSENSVLTSPKVCPPRHTKKGFQWRSPSTWFKLANNIELRKVRCMLFHKEIELTYWYYLVRTYPNNLFTRRKK